MDILNLILLFLSFIASFLLVKMFMRRNIKSSSKKDKPKALSKNDIIDGYKDQIRALNKKYSKNKVLLKKKRELLKTISQELQRNIFFEQKEITFIINNLANL